MIHFSHYGRRWRCVLASIPLFLAATFTGIAQTVPNLGTASTYGILTGAGAIENTGLTIIKGDVGTHVGSVTGFPPGIYTGTLNIANAATLGARNDLTLAYYSMNDATNAVIFDTAISATMGNGQILTSRTYGRGDLTTISGNLTFDAKGNTSAIFVIKIQGALNVAKNTSMILANGAKAINIYWAVDGAVSVLDNTVFKGNILANGAIHFYTGSTLEGRALSVVGAITLASSVVSIAPDITVDKNLVVITPAPGERLNAGTMSYQITWGGTGIASMKTLEYSLDSGATWIPIASINTDDFKFDWDVPDTVTTKGLVRITDQNSLSGTSGTFMIAKSAPADSLIVLRPRHGEIIRGGTQNYQIVWQGSGIAPEKVIEYSLDGGATWILIGTVIGDLFTYSWDVPNIATMQGLVRITDQNNLVGISGTFAIERDATSDSKIVVVRPAEGEIIAGGTVSYPVVFTAENVTPTVRIEYSLDAGVTWSLVGYFNSNAGSGSWDEVPNVSTTRALIRITDEDGVVGISKLFTIERTEGEGSINSLTLSGLDNERSIDNNAILGIMWTYTPDIGTSVSVEYSLDNRVTWNPIGVIAVSESASSSWRTPALNVYDPVHIRVTSSLGLTRTSLPFSIGRSSSAVPLGTTMDGYSIASYPNPANARASINLTLPIAGNASLSITDALGRIVASMDLGYLSTGSHNIPVPTANLPSGNYRYVVQFGNRTLVDGLIIAR